MWEDERTVKVTIVEEPWDAKVRYAVVDPTNGNYWTVFGLLQGGDSREEAVFWAERLASKNDLRFERPEGWGDVVGALPVRADSVKTTAAWMV